jgi:hypothetical protein
MRGHLGIARIAARANAGAIGSDAELTPAANGCVKFVYQSPHPIRTNIAYIAGAAPMTDQLSRPEYWRARAEEARTRADQMSDAHNREAMQRIARDYDMLAQRAEEREHPH